MADLKLATKNCIASVEKTHATKNEKKCWPVDQDKKITTKVQEIRVNLGS